MYKEILTAKQKYNLDFDDAYQYVMAKTYNLRLVTMDMDFKKVSGSDIIYIS